LILEHLVSLPVNPPQSRKLQPKDDRDRRSDIGSAATVQSKHPDRESR
jgi:hypothetical protein